MECSPFVNQSIEKEELEALHHLYLSVIIKSLSFTTFQLYFDGATVTPSEMTTYSVGVEEGGGRTATLTMTGTLLTLLISTGDDAAPLNAIEQVGIPTTERGGDDGGGGPGGGDGG